MARGGERWREVVREGKRGGERLHSFFIPSCFLSFDTFI